MRGMIVQCVGCGFGKHIKLDGMPEKIEERCHETITEGWRWEKTRKDYACPSCARSGSPDKLYELYVGKLHCTGKTESYKHLIMDMAEQIREFMWLDEMCGEVKE